MEGKIKIGPVGKQNPNANSSVTNFDEGYHNGIISQIFISHGSTGIFSIQFQFVFDDKFVLSDLHGQNTGTKFDVVALDYPHEYITGISGAHDIGAYGTPNITSLKLVTNSNEYGPFGSLGSSDYEIRFSFNLGKYPQFGGFYGAYDGYGLNVLGVYLQPITTKPKIKPETSTIDAEDVESEQIV